ncbi:MAG: 2-C-methyl-D-erythritol 4-phosphate cytidylyltransferase [Prevotella sp.]|jgi:2-C-methyl-D-erythritol 4-phosphate cytidylyltransferase|nr:2-C-methyl-D-erythritol 4-phosphate cytidylyltransferase [Prevotella sp.]
MDYVIIVAGGKGMRMGCELPKQFLPVAGKPVLMRTIERFYQFNRDLNFIIVLPQSQQACWRSLCAEHHFTISHTVVNGGDTRFASSKNGLSYIPNEAQGLVAIHDGVRPFVSVDVIDRCFNEARTSGTAIPVIPAIDSLRQIDTETGDTFTVNRSLFQAVQTPQVFDITLARKAFSQPYSDKFTDDASVIESLGIKINTVEGNRENIKLTTPFDLKIAEVIAED